MQYRLPNICVKKDFKRKEANNNGYSSGRKRSGTRNGKIPGSSVVSAQTKHRKESELQFRREVSEFALQIAEKMMRKQLSDDKTQVEMIDKLLNEIENQN